MAKKPVKKEVPTFDLASYTQRDTYKCKILIPGTDSVIPVADGSDSWIEHYGFTSPKYEDFLKMMRKERAEAVREGIIDEDEETDRAVVKRRLVDFMTVGWNLSFGGQKLDFTQANKDKIFQDAQRSFVVDQLYESIHTQANFIDASALN